MKCKVIPLLMICMFLTLACYSQKITLNIKNAPVQNAFNVITNQTGYRFIYKDSALLNARLVTMDIKNASLQEALINCARNQIFTFNVDTVKKQISVVRIDHPLDHFDFGLPLIDFSGWVTNENGEALPGVTIEVRNFFQETITDDKGNFTLKGIDPNASLIITSVGYEKIDTCITNIDYLRVRMKIAVSSLDEAVVLTVYGRTTKRFNTGSVSTITNQQIERGQNDNPLIAMQGRVPGLLVSQSSGIPGSAVSTQLQGQSAFTESGLKNDPIYLIDGMPVPNNNNSSSNILSGTAFGPSGSNPFASLNVKDIESIEVLKDADATAIYGSRAQNGIVLITTKKGIKGKAKISTDFYNAIGMPVKRVKFLNTAQYIQMRKEALQNDSISATSGTDNDVLVFDTTRNANFQKLLIGNHSKINNVNMTVSGGFGRNLYYASADYRSETSVFSDDLHNRRGSLHMRFDDTSKNKKFWSTFICNATLGENKLISTDLSAYTTLPPNMPELHSSQGDLNWDSAGLFNPLAYFLQKYRLRTKSLMLRMSAEYSLIKNLTLKLDLGYSGLWLRESEIIPIKSINPYISPPPMGSAYFANTVCQGRIIEPQIRYGFNKGKGKFNFFIGSSLQSYTNRIDYVLASGYKSDADLLDTKNAGNVEDSLQTSMYKNAGIFAQLNCNWNKKYVLNFTGRRDGSSRFPTKTQIRNFGAIGFGWIFSEESFFKEKIKFINYGKFRTSYGVMGNDQIGDNKYIENWVRVPYQGYTGVAPWKIVDSLYKWQLCYNLNIAFELGFFQNRISASVDYFRKITANQINASGLAYTTGWSRIAATNSDAKILNSGIELELHSINIKTKSVTWNTDLLLTIPHNKLLSFPDLSSSAYADHYKVGESLTTQYGYHLLGVDATNGNYRFFDKNNDSLISYKNDYIHIGNLDPVFYGSLENTFSYKNWTLNMLFEFRKQKGENYLNIIYTSAQPGAPMQNQPVAVLNHWQKAGDNAIFQKYTTESDATGIRNFLQSDGRFSDASFIRTRNISVTYNLPTDWINKLYLENCSFYFKATNPFTITSYKVFDIETKSMTTVPVLKTFGIGIRCTIK